MLRTVPETINEEVDLYIRTYYSLLRSSQAIRVRSLEDTHAGTHASLHPKADDPEPLPSDKAGLEGRAEAANLVVIYAAMAGTSVPAHARILVADRERLSKDRRKEFVARAATGD